MNDIVITATENKSRNIYSRMIFCLVIMVTYILYDYLTFTYYQHSLFSISGISLSAIPMILIVGFSLCVMLFNKINTLILLGLIFVIYEFVITAINMAYSISQLPFRAVEMFCWLGIFTVTYFCTKKSGKADLFLKMVLPFSIIFIIKCWNIFLDASINVYGLYNSVFYVLFFLPFFLLIKNNILKNSMLLIVFATVIMSYKRSAILILVLSVAYYFWAEIGGKSTINKKIGILFGIAFLIIIGVVLFNYLQAKYQLDWLARIQDAAESGGSGRLDIWNNMWDAMKKQSFTEWLGGHGYRTTGIFGGAHNDFLEILYDYGIIGFILYFSIIVLLFRYVYFMKKCSYKYRSAFVASLILFLGYSFVGQLFIMPQWFF